MEISFPTLKRGANKHCAYGAAARTFHMQFSIMPFPAKKQIRNSSTNKHRAWMRSMGLETHATAGREAGATVWGPLGRYRRWGTDTKPEDRLPDTRCAV